MTPYCGNENMIGSHSKQPNSCVVYGCDNFTKSLDGSEVCQDCWNNGNRHGHDEWRKMKGENEDKRQVAIKKTKTDD